VALKLLNSYPDLFTEASEKSSKLSVLVALAKVPHSFPTGSGFGPLDQFIYDSKFSMKRYAPEGQNSFILNCSCLVTLNELHELLRNFTRIAFFFTVLSVEKEFAKNYGNSNANFSDFVLSVTRGVNGSKHKTSTTESWSAGGVCRHVLNVLFLPVKLLGMLI
jgi:hypothetical protein